MSLYDTYLIQLYCPMAINHWVKPVRARYSSISSIPHIESRRSFTSYFIEDSDSLQDELALACSAPTVFPASVLEGTSTTLHHKHVRLSILLVVCKAYCLRRNTPPQVA